MKLLLNINKEEQGWQKTLFPKEEAKTMQTEHNKKIFLDLYYDQACNVSETCKAIGISRTTFYNWLNSDQSFKEGIMDIEVALVEMAECQLIRNIKAGKETSLIFFLTNRAPEKWKHKSHFEQIIENKPDFDEEMKRKILEYYQKMSAAIEAHAQHFKSKEEQSQRNKGM